MTTFRFPRLLALLPVLLASGTSESVRAADEPAMERREPGFDQLIAPGTPIRDLGGGFRWAEGPAWNAKTGELLLSDVPNNTIHAWNPESGFRVFLKPSGFLGASSPAREPGSNGLAFDAQGRLLVCEHGERSVARHEADGKRTVLAGRFEGKRFNSPNDLTVHPDGSVYFTDPIYGLPRGEKDPGRELDFCGVFRVRPDGTVDLMVRDMERPNGIALSPDAKTLYVANSHGPRPVIMAYPLGPDGRTGPGKVFFDARGLDGPGAPDGLKVDADGVVWSTGPGGLLVITPDGRLLGRVLARRATANVAFGGADGKSVFLTSTDRLLVLRRK